MDIGDLQVRNRGTLGGSLAHADPASDMPAVALAWMPNWSLNSKGERTVAADAFFHSPFVTDLRPEELLTQICIPALPAGAGTAYRQLVQRASGYSLVGVAAVVASPGGTISHVRVGITGVGDHAYRASAVEAALQGKKAERGRARGCRFARRQGQEVGADIHADREYRTAMAAVYVRRAWEAALARAGSA